MEGKMKNKIINFALIFCLILPCFIVLTACGKQDENPQTKVMTVALNPSVEFVLDEDDVVVSVSALNDDGNFIVDCENFIGLSADEAVDLFLEISKENGLILEDVITDLKIEISGEKAKELFKKVSNSAKDYLKSANIQLNVLFDEISKEEIKSKVQECMRELSDVELNKLSEEELISLLKKSRKETSNLLSQELKELFYYTRAQELMIAKCEQAKTILNSFNLTGEYDEEIEAFQIVYDDYLEALEVFNAQYEAIYINPNSDYQKAVQSYVSAKKALLEARLDEIVDLSQYEQALSDARDALYGNAEKSIVGVEQTVQTMFFEYKIALEQAEAEVEKALNSAFELVSDFIDFSEIQSQINNMINGFKNSFNDKFSSYIEENSWLDLKPNRE